MVDFVVCLGGDGVLLHASMLFKHSIPPLISFNLGSLGFLTNHDFRHFRANLSDVIHGCEDLSECSMPDESLKVGATTERGCAAKCMREPVPECGHGSHST